MVACAGAIFLLSSMFVYMWNYIQAFMHLCLVWLWLSCGGGKIGEWNVFLFNSCDTLIWVRVIPVKFDQSLTGKVRTYNIIQVSGGTFCGQKLFFWRLQPVFSNFEKLSKHCWNFDEDKQTVLSKLLSARPEEHAKMHFVLHKRLRICFEKEKNVEKIHTDLRKIFSIFWRTSLGKEVKIEIYVSWHRSVSKNLSEEIEVLSTSSAL